MLRTVSLFAGCGGMTLGFKGAGYKIMASFDNWESAIRVYSENFSDHRIFNVDLGQENLDLKIIAGYKPELIIGGPPCQDFSSAGKRNEELGRADLTVIYANIVSAVRPRFFVMENVDRIKKTITLQKTLDIMKSAFYGITWKILDASFYGVPQKRKRFFLIGEHLGDDGFLLPYLDKRITTKPMTIREYMGSEIDFEYYYRHPRTYNRRAIFSIDEPSPTIRGVNRPIPKTYKSHPGDKANVDGRVRALTTKERSIIQTFPKDFKFDGSKTDLELMIGNAVPVKLAEFVAKCLKSYISDNSGKHKNL